jgi:hypothetical protein
MPKKKYVTHGQFEVEISEMPKSAELISVIRTNLKMIGEGTDKSPYRIIEQYWSLNGELLFQKDPMEVEG